MNVKEKTCIKCGLPLTSNKITKICRCRSAGYMTSYLSCVSALCNKLKNFILMLKRLNFLHEQK